MRAASPGIKEGIGVDLPDRGAFIGNGRDLAGATNGAYLEITWSRPSHDHTGTGEVNRVIKEFIDRVEREK